MTRDIDIARAEAQEAANERHLTMYLYRLRSGYYYANPSHPREVISQFVEVFYPREEGI